MSRAEIKGCIEKMQCNKAAGYDGIPAELFKLKRESPRQMAVRIHNKTPKERKFEVD